MSICKTSCYFLLQNWIQVTNSLDYLEEKIVANNKKSLPKKNTECDSESDSSDSDTPAGNGIEEDQQDKHCTYDYRPQEAIDSFGHESKKLKESKEEKWKIDSFENESDSYSTKWPHDQSDWQFFMMSHYAAALFLNADYKMFCSDLKVLPNRTLDLIMIIHFNQVLFIDYWTPGLKSKFVYLPLVQHVYILNFVNFNEVIIMLVLGIFFASRTDEILPSNKY